MWGLMTAVRMMLDWSDVPGEELWETNTESRGEDTQSDQYYSAGPQLPLRRKICETGLRMYVRSRTPIKVLEGLILGFMHLQRAVQYDTTY